MNVHLQSIDPARGRRRRYTIQLQPCLWGGVDVISTWGRVGQAGGVTRSEHFPALDSALRRCGKILLLRARHGYVILSNSLPA